MVGWSPDPDASDRMHDVYFSDLPTIDLEAFSTWIVGRRGTPDDELSDTYADALYDLARLLEEIRFGTAAASLYLFSLEAELRTSRPAPEDDLAIPIKVMALLAPHFASVPTPDAYLKNRGVPSPANGSSAAGGPPSSSTRR
jgi:hypothetical protein